jgi:hypothetical protein
LQSAQSLFAERYQGGFQLEPSKTKDSNGRDRRHDMCMTRYAASAFGIAPSNQRRGNESLFCLGEAIKSNGFHWRLIQSG